MDVFRTPDERFAGLPDYPFEPHWFEHDGLRMHYVDEGNGDPVLLVHGEPTWSFLWRKIVPPVADRARAIAPDLIGFGRSDKPTDLGWYSYDRHFESLLAFVQALDLHRVTLVVHDWGGPIGLRVAVTEPDRIERLVILDTGLPTRTAASDGWLRFREMLRQVGNRIEIGRVVAAGTARGLDNGVRAAYDAPFPTPESKAGTLVFPELVPTEPDHPNAIPMRPVYDALASWQKPTLVAWGADDAVLPTTTAELFVDHVPGASGPVIVERAGHFLQEDAPAEVTAAILGVLA